MIVFCKSTCPIASKTVKTVFFTDDLNQKFLDTLRELIFARTYFFANEFFRHFARTNFREWSNFRDFARTNFRE